MFGLDATAGIRNPHTQQGPLGQRGFDGQRAATLHRGDGILDKLDEGGLQLQRIPAHGRADLGHALDQFDVGAGEILRPAQFECVVEDGGDVQDAQALAALALRQAK